MYSSSTKIEYATDITLRRIVRLKSYRMQRKKVQKVLLSRVLVPRAD
jgi:hypothetical protein